MSNDDKDIPNSMYWIHPLKEDNWMLWKRRMTAFLDQKKLLSYVTSEIQKPEPSANPDTREARNAEIQKWGEKDQRARNLIIMCLDDAQVIHTEGVTMAHHMWDLLRTVKELKGQHGIIALSRVFYDYHADEGVNILKHIAKLREIREQLQTMGKQITDADFNGILIKSLPSSWDSYMASYTGAMSSQPNSPPMMALELIAVVIGEYRCRLDRDQHVEPEQALTAQSQKRKRDLIKKCSICHKMGHTARLMNAETEASPSVVTRQQNTSI
ncbi:hypothetical protein SCP_1900210 [Sparassis crispa]|uniref:Uncharacterized protein n=1 Tax=Sparassis crispa TaxID=139825 RepID=A0A401H6X7_9APHY|nr:hypothetical protein SCP_1900210 [Sparassis crispa]GBE90172.1 hypothetical protein SCP_1900210 [Sparassis crispa]